MNNKLTHKQMTIRRLAALHTHLADAWLSSKGLSANTFTAGSTLVQRAVVTAKTLQRAHAQLLKSCDAHMLASFQRAAAGKRTRARITDGFCHRVLNISTAVNRQLFAAQNKLIKAQGTSSNTQINTTQSPNNTKAI